MSTRFIGGNLPGGPAKPKPKSRPEQVGSCVVCKAGIFSDQDYGRAPKPLLGKAHAYCGGMDGREQLLAEQFPPVAELERERVR